MKRLTIILCSISLIALNGCAITTAGVKKGDERNLARSINDVTAGRAISARMNRAHDFDLDKVDIEVAEGIAVLTGRAPTDKDRIEAERIAWSAPNVVQVGNEIVVGDEANFFRGGKDSFIGTKIRSRLIAEKGVKARNVNIETYDGKVFLLGVARNSAELERISYIASTTKGVKEVISYIKIADQPVVTSAGFTPQQTHNIPPAGAAPDPSIPFLSGSPQNIPQSAQRQLPDYLTEQPSAPVDPNAPFFRDPATGEVIVLPPGTKVVPYNPGTSPNPLTPKVGDAPYYINPSNGEKVQIVWTGG